LHEENFVVIWDIPTEKRNKKGCDLLIRIIADAMSNPLNHDSTLHSRGKYNSTPMIHAVAACPPKSKSIN